MSDCAALHAMGMDAAINQKLLDLCDLYREKSKQLVAAAGGTHEAVVYDAIDLDLINVIMQILPMVLKLFAGGFGLPAIIDLVKMVLPLLVKSEELRAILLQIIEALVGILGNK